MIPGLRGSLLSHEALREAGFVSVHERDGLSRVRRAMSGCVSGVMQDGGPAWNARMVFDRIAAPFWRALGAEPVLLAATADRCHGILRRRGDTASAFVTFGWGRGPSAGWTDGIRTALDSRVRWCFAFNGPTLRAFDAGRAHSRRFMELQLDLLASHDELLSLTWNLFGPRSNDKGLDVAIGLSEQFRVDVRGALQEGVIEALTELTGAFYAATRRAHGVVDESLVVIYRVLFLLFAEARRLVPAWHPVYDDGYTIESLRVRFERPRADAGTWESLQAIARLAHSGCRAGTLRVPPFNGRLFSPEHARLADTVRLDDSAVTRAIAALTTRRTVDGRRRIAFADLGVEHLGGVYERVLDLDLRPDRRASPRLVSSGRRKGSGSFYTPRPLTEYLVRRTLAPLVHELPSERILELRVLDPAMGSGAFLVAACRYLGAVYEAALIREGVCSATDVTDADRAAFRRLVAQRTLFGVDINPMAVQLARLSLWLTTLCGDRPLTFFDHHLRVGNSLVGASLADVTRVRSGRQQPLAATPLLPDEPVDAALSECVIARRHLTTGGEETLDQVRRKEALYARLVSDRSPLNRWRAICDLWCSGWFPDGQAAVDPRTLRALLATVSGSEHSLGRSTVDGLLARGRRAGDRERFFHWELEFPEVFRAADGTRLARPGFDAILGNPPWEMLRGDAGEAGTRTVRFARGSGTYQLQGHGHTNLYQLFLERSLALARAGGRLGFIVPSGVSVDLGSAPIRRFLLDRTLIDSFLLVDNREALFPIHRGLKFVLATMTVGAGPTRQLPQRTGMSAAAEFDTLPDREPDPLAVNIPRRVIDEFSGEQLAVPELRSARDLEIVARVLETTRAAGDRAGWGLTFGRELNATEDKGHFTQDRRGLPVIEGKHVGPFTVDVAGVRHFLPHACIGTVGRGSDVHRPRLAYRDVAAATNRLTLIAAILPAGTITTHTLFCLKTGLPEEQQHFLAGIFNSFVANYLVRLRVTTHVTVAAVEQLRLPGPCSDTTDARAVAALARRLADRPDDEAAMARLQGAASRLYGLDRDQFAHVLSSFPLVDPGLRQAALSAFSRTL